MLKERAAVEQNYSKHLNNWAEKWAKYYEKKPEFGTLGAGYQAMIQEARQCANIHTTVNSCVKLIYRLSQQGHQRSLMGMVVSVDVYSW